MIYLKKKLKITYLRQIFLSRRLWQILPPKYW